MLKLTILDCKKNFINTEITLFLRYQVPGWWFFMSENVDTAEETTEVAATEESPIPQPQPAQVQLPPNEDPGEMMMATIASS